jgi:hypothetical protein
VPFLRKRLREEVVGMEPFIVSVEYCGLFRKPLTQLDTIKFKGESKWDILECDGIESENKVGPIRKR